MIASTGESKLPAPDWLIENIAEASRNARKIYFLFVAFLAYWALTVVSTSDRRLILNEPARLPLVDVEVPLIGFFIIAPILGILVFVYLQLYLHHLKGLLGSLRKNYAPIEERRLYPWMVNIAEDPEPGAIGALQKLAVRFSLWWQLPIALVLNALWFAKRHDPYLAYVIAILAVVGSSMVSWFWLKYNYSSLTECAQMIGHKLVTHFTFAMLAYFVFVSVLKTTEFSSALTQPDQTRFVAAALYI